MNLEKIFTYAPIDRLDSAQNIFYARELEYILTELVEYDYAKITHRDFFPIDSSAGAAADSIVMRQITRTGMAKIIADYSDEIPTVNAYTEESIGRIRSIAIGAQWSLQEIRAAASTGKPLDREYALAAREAMLRKENVIAFDGDASHNLVGLFSSGTGIPFAAVAGAVWTSKTPAQILFDMQRASNEPSENTGDNESPDTLALPPAQYNYIHETGAGTSTDTTIAKYFLANSPTIKRITKHRELAGKGPGSTDVMVAYEANARKIQLNVPLDIEQLPPERDGLVTRVIYHSRCGGLTIRKPLSVNMKHGI